MYSAKGKKVPNKGGLPMAVGVVVQNVGTAVAVYEAVRFKKPLIERVITVTGKDAASGTKGVMRVGDGLAAAAGNVTVDAGDGFHNSDSLSNDDGAFAISLSVANGTNC